MEVVNDFSASMYLPRTLFETVARFDDTTADDMQCGDMSDQDLFSLGLSDISAKVDPYRLIHYDFPMTYQMDSIYNTSVSGRKISRDECIDILFTEMKDLVQMFSFWGAYKALIVELIDHFRHRNGSGFYSQRLNLAFHERINSYFVDNPRLIIEGIIRDEFNSKPDSIHLPSLLNSIKRSLLESKLPKFDSRIDRINGLGISVHDIAVQKITLVNLQRYAMGWSA
ncbi:uncharacterized DUF3289 family protein [Trabulsiella guamensis ATCC 49490]|uniref:Uncharacterized DUF3289 family protein n=1 Tax=Trabulsiella guamensis ATCC 49490 TaxID=1005994 RepID=A0A085AB93_9ENTR|nr:uncharacterized DUF3289 family protein [Trabulsiella guamensis ATCC 49490]